MTRDEHLVLQLATALRTLPPDSVGMTERLSDDAERVWTVAEVLAALENGGLTVSTL